MNNRAIDTLVVATSDSLKNLKKILGSTVLATTLVATSFFAGTPSANAAAVTSADGTSSSLNDELDQAIDTIVMAAKIAMTTTTIRSSTIVNPLAFICLKLIILLHLFRRGRCFLFMSIEGFINHTVG